MPDNCKVLKIENPILTETDLLKIKAMNVPGFKVVTLSICYYKNTDLEKAIDRLFVDVDRAYRDGANILDPVRPRTLTSTTSPSPAFWLWAQSASTWSAPASARLWR